MVCRISVNKGLENYPLNEERRPRLAILASHVVQYHAPLYREIAATGKVDLTVLYCARYGLEPVYDPTMDTKIEWDVPMLEGYRFEFMTNLSRSTYRPLLGRVNPGIIVRLFRDRYDVILIQDYFYLTSWLALSTAKIAKKKIIFRGEGTLKSNRDSLGNHLKHRIIRAFIKAADLVLYSCNGNKKWLEYLGADSYKMALIPCSVDNDFFRIQHNLILSGSESPKKQLGLDEDVLYVISAARMDPNKKLVDIVKAVAVLQKNGFPVGLLLVGDGPNRYEIEHLVQELGLKNVHLPGFVNMSRISAYYAAADVFVLASEYDPSPKALSEALIFSLPAVCTDTIGTAGDLVVDGVNGFLYPVGNLEILVDRLFMILSNRGLREAMGRKSLEISDQWSMKAAAKSVVDAVNRLTGRSI
jgi:glycosyltransferase involved in cell wall biosynthesis